MRGGGDALFHIVPDSGRGFCGAALSTTAMRPGARAAVIVAALALTSLGSIATYYGLASALFGSHYGLVTTYLRKRRDNGTDDD